MRAALLDIVRWRDARDTVGTPERSGWRAFAEELTQPKVCATKATLPAFSPVRLDGTRKDENVRAVSMLVLDYDGGQVSAQSARTLFSKYRGVVYTTFSHREEAPKYRIVLPLRSAVRSADALSLLRKLHKWARSQGLPCDPTTMNPSRIWFMPGVFSPDAPFACSELEGAEYVSENNVPVVARSEQVQAILDSFRRAAEGTRNHALNAAAFAIGKTTAPGSTERDDALGELELLAREVGLESAEIRATIRSGLGAGERAAPLRVDEWEPPVEFDQQELPPFPVYALPEATAAFVENAAQALQVPSDLLALPLMAIFASTIARNLVVRVRSAFVEPLCLYTLVLLPAGERKTSALKLISEPIRRFEARKIAEYMRERDRLLEAGEEVTESPTRFICDDVTPEVLISLLAQHSRLLLLSDEAGGLFGLLQGRYSN